MQKGILITGIVVTFLCMASLSHSEMKGDAGSGKGIYEKNCAMCHGKEGKGDGMGAKSLKPKASNFSDPTVAAKSDKDLYDAITKGKPGSAMISFEKTLTEQQRWDVIAFIRSLGGKK
jgi:mono/diheme cytochrome c family protein